MQSKALFITAFLEHNQKKLTGEIVDFRRDYAQINVSLFLYCNKHYPLEKVSHLSALILWCLKNCS